jgi:acyl-coenzyme A thioesterase PaaI-like protein
VSAARDEAFAALTAKIPYIKFLGVHFQRRGDEVTAQLSYAPHLIGNPMLPALHGGATGAFLEITALTSLSWIAALEQIGETESWDGQFAPQPKTVDFSIDYLRSGKPQDAYARALILRRGRRVANVRVEAWQEERSKPFVAAHGHFLLPQQGG